MTTFRFRTPPDWMRFFVPWFVLEWVNEHFEVCWANVVMWKLYGGHSWWPSRACFDGGYDYCMKFEEPPNYDSPDDFVVIFPPRDSTCPLCALGQSTDSFGKSSHTIPAGSEVAS